MDFAQRLKKARMAAGLTQVELAEKLGVTSRSIQHYELGQRMPRKFETVEKLAEILNVEVNDLFDTKTLLLIGAQEKGGAKSARDVEELVSEVSALFAGGELAEEEKDAVMLALTEAYWDAKKVNKKYTPKKYRRKRKQ
jgi:transcriptional regulator with XRE-family HTH domain